MAAKNSIVVRVIGDASHFQKTLNSVDNEAKGFGSRIGTMAKTVGASLAAAGIAKFGKDSISAFTESQKVAAQTAAVLKSTGGAAGVTAGHLDNLASKLQKVSGVEDEAIASGANMLLTFTGIKNGVGEGNAIFDEATKTLLDLSVAMGSEPKAAAIQLGKALNDPVTGITALTRVGVTFTKQQKDQIKSLVASGKTMAAQKIILAELNREFGGSAAAAGKARTPMERLSLQMGELQEKVGAALVPALHSLTDLVLKIVGAFTALPGPAQAAIAAFAGLALGLVAAAKVVTALKLAWTALNLSFLASPVGLIIAGIAALAAGLVIAYKKSETFRNIVDGAFRVVKGAMDAVVEVGGRVFEFFGRNWGLILSPLTGGLSLVAQHFDTVKAAIRAVLEWLGKIPAAVDKALGPLDEIVGKGASIVGKGVGAVAKGVGRLVPKFDSGGVMPGPRGVHSLALVAGGETVLPTHKQPMAGTLSNVTNFHVTGPVVASDPMELRRQLEVEARRRRLTSLR